MEFSFFFDLLSEPEELWDGDDLIHPGGRKVLVAVKEQMENIGFSASDVYRYDDSSWRLDFELNTGVDGFINLIYGLPCQAFCVVKKPWIDALKSIMREQESSDIPNVLLHTFKSMGNISNLQMFSSNITTQPAFIQWLSRYEKGQKYVQ